MRSRSGAAIQNLVVALIAISLLVAAGITQVEEGRVRALVSRSRMDLRDLARATEAYRVDQGVPPNDVVSGWPWITSELITTPVAYLPRVPVDPFRIGSSLQVRYRLVNLIAGEEGWVDSGVMFPGWVSGIRNALSASGWSEARVLLGDWKLSGAGPDGVTNTPFLDGYLLYDSTNGAVSAGDLVWIHSAGALPPID